MADAPVFSGGEASHLLVEESLLGCREHRRVGEQFFSPDRRGAAFHRQRYRFGLILSGLDILGQHLR